ncbi:MAG: hypothetical protein KDD66_06760 [Bdellovibrionales bacterium]|nr:hypothetical protein [Bdellovibrionales bacterium]
MPADVTSAGTMIAAVLETAGQVTQHHILQDFNSFFHQAGAFLYILAAMGGIVSFVLFNSFRMVRYMLIGPTVFWFLVGVSTDSQGVVWELADGTQHSTEPVFSGTTPLSAFKPPSGTMRVSYVFSLVTETINEIVAELTKVVLHQKKDNQLMFVARNRAFESLIGAKVDQPQLLSIIEDNLLSENCGQMMNYSLALSNKALSRMQIGSDDDINFGTNGTNALKSTHHVCDVDDPSSPDYYVGEQEKYLEAAQAVGNAAEVARLTKSLEGYLKLRQDYCAKYDFYKTQFVEANPSTLQFFREVQEEPGYVQQFLDSSAGPPNYGYSGRRVCAPSDPPQLSCTNAIYMSCEQMWNVTKQAIMKQADWFSTQLLGKIEPDGSTDNEGQILCRELWKKVHPDQAAPPLGNCDLVNSAAIFLIRNSITERMGDRVNQMVKNRVPSLGMMKTVDDGTIVLGDEYGDVTEGARKHYLKDPVNIEFRASGEDDPIGLGHVLVKAYELGENGEKTNNVKWVPYARMGQISGQMDAAFDEHQAYQTRGLRQKIFTWAMQLPYYQGVILYMISVAYPFMCLCVLIPGRAGAILAVPMAWLWVKSWDLGFAMVMVLDDILWNMFPKRDIGVDLGSASVQVEEVLTEAFKIDPSYNVHGYYMFVSMCLMAVPAITGYATLKSRASVLASFVDGPRSQTSDAGDKAEGAYGIQRMNQRVQQQNETRGMAQLSKSGNFGAMVGQGRGMTAAGWAIAQGASKGLAGLTNGSRDTGLSKEERGMWSRLNEKNRKLGKPPISQQQFLSERKRAGNAKNLVGALTDGAAEIPRAFASMLDKEVSFASKNAAAFDGTFGRYGSYQMMQDAAAAAMDGAGGFEVNSSDRPGNSAINERISLYSARLSAFQNISGNAVEALTGLMGGGASGGSNMMAERNGYSKRDLLINAAPAAWGLADRFAPELTHAVGDAIEDGANMIFDKLGIGSFQTIDPGHFNHTTYNRTYGDIDLYTLDSDYD